jgi:hypothetical protein
MTKSIFQTIKDQDEASRVTSSQERFDPGIQLYKAFVQALEGQDRLRFQRIRVRLNNYNRGLTKPQRRDFALLLVLKDIIPKESKLGQAILTFKGRIVEI